MQLMARTDVGYSHRDFPDWGLSVVGGRPFSWGGPDWRCAEFYQQRFGVHNFAESAARISTAALSASQPTLIFLSHNGPTELGDQAHAPCGKDWRGKGETLGGDFGDPDLRQGMTVAQAQGRQIALVAFGHMHHHLRHTQAIQRTRLVADANGIIYLNAAAVPRIRATSTGYQRNFSVVSLINQQVAKVELVWLDQDLHIVSAEILYKAEEPSLDLALKS